MYTIHLPLVHSLKDISPLLVAVKVSSGLTYLAHVRSTHAVGGTVNTRRLRHSRGLLVTLQLELPLVLAGGEKQKVVSLKKASPQR